MSKKAPETPAADAAPQKKGKGKLIIIAVAALVLLGGGGGAAWFFLMGNGHDKTAHKKKEEHKAPPVFVNLEPFTVNLQKAEGDDHYLQTEIVLQVTDEHAIEPIKARMPMIRSDILMLLSGKSAAEIASADGKKKLAQQIIGEARKHVAQAGSGKGIENLYFSSFVIQ
jgi:flagellar protein FliL